MTEVGNDQVAYAVPCCSAIYRVAAVGLNAAVAQTAPGPANSTAVPSEARRHGQERMMPGQFVEGPHRVFEGRTQDHAGAGRRSGKSGRAAAMRENAKALDQRITAARQNRGVSGRRPAPRDARAVRAKVRADNTARLTAAFKPLYASLSPEQQQMANQLVGSHHHWRHRA